MTPEIAEATLQARRASNDSSWRLKLRPVQEVYAEPVRDRLFVYLGLMSLLLLLACVHVLRQQWSRMVIQQTIWMQGATPDSWSRYLFAGLGENILLALAGGLLGLGLARLFVGSLLGPLLGDFAHLFDVNVDTRVLGFALSLSLLLGLTMGLLPVVLLPDTWKKATDWRRPFKGVRGHWTEGGLMALEVALALILLVTAGLMGRGLLERQSAESGFDPDSVLTMTIPLSGPQYEAGRAQVAYFGEVFTRLDSLDGIQAASLSLALPGGDQQPEVPIFLSKQAPTAERSHVKINVVGTDYLDMMGVSLRQGRLFEAEDNRREMGATVINEAMAARYWRGENPVGQHLYLDNAEREPVEIIGVVGDIPQSGFSSHTAPTMYWLYWRVGGPTMRLAIKARTDPLALAASVQETLRLIDKNVPLEQIGLMDEVLAERKRTDFLFVAVFAVLALMALAMVAVSIYRSMTHAVHIRSREIGIRRMLGATTYDVQLLTLRPVMGRVAAGVAMGLVGAALIMPFFAGWLFEGNPLDPMAYMSGVVLLVIALLVVACTSARQAAQLDPVLALRYG